MKSLSPKRVILQVDNSGIFGYLLIKGIVHYATHQGHWSFYREISGVSRRLEKSLKGSVDGIIAQVRNAKVAKRIIPNGMPAVVKGDEELIPGVCNLIYDAKAIGQMGFQHLKSLGIKRIAFCGYKEVLWAHELINCFRSQLTGVYMLPKTSVKISSRKKAEQIAYWLHTLAKPVGIIVSQDECGQCVLDACKMAGYRVPSEVSVLGVDNDEWICSLTSPPMTSIAMNTEQAGYEAAQRLDELMSGLKTFPPTIQIQPIGVITRQSTDLFSVEDPEVRKAIEYIRKNFEKQIQLDDVVNATSISRRVLYERFKRTLGRSINEELRRIRVEYIAQKLVETKMTISQITADCQFTSYRNVARYFKREKGMSLLQYRKKFGTFV